MYNAIKRTQSSFLYTYSKAHRTALITVFLALRRHQFTLQDHGYGASASRGVPVYATAYTGTH